MSVVIRQRTNGACGVASLAMLVIDAVMRQVDPDMRGLDGLWTRELIRSGAEVRPISLKAVRVGQYDPDTDTGILRVRWRSKPRKKESPNGHYVALIDGIVHCPDLDVAMPWREYMVRFQAKEGSLLKVIR